MRLPFVIISRAHYEELLRCWRQADRVEEAYRWLAEFDWLLAPLWHFLRDTHTGAWGGICGARDEMRRLLDEFRVLSDHISRKDSDHG